eukprot:jgi/Astpho2/6102/Aster-x0716
MESEQLEREKQKADVQKQQEVQQEQGEDLELHLRMPDGTDAVVEARLGYTVEYVKALLHERFGLPIAQQRLTCEGRPMIDPLSLSDCTGIKQGAPNLIDVKVAH